MARLQPHSEAEFARIHGVGTAKLDQFAELFLAVVEAVLLVSIADP